MLISNRSVYGLSPRKLTAAPTNSDLPSAGENTVTNTESVETVSKGQQSNTDIILYLGPALHSMSMCSSGLYRRQSQVETMEARPEQDALPGLQAVTSHCRLEQPWLMLAVLMLAVWMQGPSVQDCLRRHRQGPSHHHSLPRHQVHLQRYPTWPGTDWAPGGDGDGGDDYDHGRGRHPVPGLDHPWHCSVAA